MFALSFTYAVYDKTGQSHAVFVRHILSVVFFCEILVKIALICWTVFQTELRPNLMQCYFIKKAGCHR